jgi:hypothetical protein
MSHIILAQWYDLYDMAARAEYRGIGIYGNKKVAPDIEAVEFGAAVARLVRPGKGCWGGMQGVLGEEGGGGQDSGDDRGEGVNTAPGECID